MSKDGEQAMSASGKCAFVYEDGEPCHFPKDYHGRRGQMPFHAFVPAPAAAEKVWQQGPVRFTQSPPAARVEGEAKELETFYPTDPLTPDPTDETDVGEVVVLYRNKLMTVGHPEDCDACAAVGDYPCAFHSLPAARCGDCGPDYPVLICPRCDTPPAPREKAERRSNMEGEAMQPIQHPTTLWDRVESQKSQDDRRFVLIGMESGSSFPVPAPDAANFMIGTRVRIELSVATWHSPWVR